MNPETPAAVPPPAAPEERKHHKFGPSKLGYVAECAAYTGKSESNDAADQGTFLHELMELMLKQVIKGACPTTLEQISAWVMKHNELTDEEVEYLKFACKRCDAYLLKKPTGIITEINVSIKRLNGEELTHGYLDVLFVFGAVKTGILLDFKFGWVPVPPAKTNFQGKAYVLGCFEKFPELDRIGMEFVQPKLNRSTSALFDRKEFKSLYAGILSVIDRAILVQAKPEEAQQHMKVGAYCDYCALNASCTVLNNTRAIAANKMSLLPLPPSFKGLELTRPEDIALARYWVDIIETGVDELKKRAFEMAQINGGSISCKLPSGEVITYEIKERNPDRTLGSAIEIAEVFKEVTTPNEILGAAELSVGKLESVVVTSMCELAKANGGKLTKKDAKEQMMAVLEAHNLVTQADRKIQFLKRVKAAAPEPAQISDKK